VPYNLNFRVEMGPTESTILEIARQLSADLIVLGLRAPDAFVDHLVWLSAYRIVCEARCPVLTVRSRKRPQL
jgi:nucleotide-binding universal stress UspA family protein